MAKPARLANRTIYSLEDILAWCIRAREHWLLALDLAEKVGDPDITAALARLRDDMAEIQRLARDARDGRYEGSGNNG